MTSPNPNQHSMKTHPHTLNITLDENGLLQTTEERPVLHKAPATPAQASGNCRASHSPLPWTVMITDGKPPKIINAGKPGFIATLGFPNEGDREANAAFIVRACNNAQRLADALKATADFQMSPILAADGYQAALKQLCQLKRNARLALEQFEKSQSHSDIFPDTMSGDNDALAQWEKDNE